MFKKISVVLLTLSLTAWMAGCSSGGDAKSAADEMCECMKITYEAKDSQDPAVQDEANNKYVECVKKFEEKYKKFEQDEKFIKEFQDAFVKCQQEMQGKATESK